MIQYKNSVFIATSLDGYIADRSGGLDWLHAVPNPEGIDMGFESFMSGIDAVVMGRTTFETVCGFGIDWPYSKPVFVLSNTMSEIPDKFQDHAQLIKGTLKEITESLQAKGFYRLYVDGGTTIRGFLQEDRIDEMIITTIPVLLGGGSPLFGDLDKSLHFKCVSTEIYLERVVQNRYVRIR